MLVSVAVLNKGVVWILRLWRHGVLTVLTFMASWGAEILRLWRHGVLVLQFAGVMTFSYNRHSEPAVLRFLSQNG